MANVRVEAAAVTVQTTAAGTSPSLAEAASDPTTLALAATCPFIRSVLASQDPQAISNTLAPFMAVANTTNATSAFAHRARGVSPASKRPAATAPAEPVGPASGTPGGGRDIVGDDWVMTDINGADAPIAQTGREIGVDDAEPAPASTDVSMVDTTAAGLAEAVAASASPSATSVPAEPAAASVPAEAGPSMPTAPAGREITVQAPSQTEPGAGGAPSAPAAADQAAKARAEAPKEATADDATAPGAAAPGEATHHPAGSPSKQ